MIAALAAAALVVAAAAAGQSAPSQTAGQILSEIDAAERARDGARLVERLTTLIEHHPDGIRSIDDRLPFELVAMKRQQGDAEGANRLTLRLAELGVGHSDLADGNGVRSAAAEAAIALGDEAAARRWLGKIVEPRSLRRMLTDRTYERFWPMLEAAAGPAMATASEAFVAEAEAGIAAYPDDPRMTRRLLQAYAATGRLADADRVGRAVAPTAADSDMLTLEGAWIVNDHAGVLYRLGHSAEADDRFANLLTPAVRAKPWAVNMAINRLESAVARGNWSSADALIGEAEKASTTTGNAYSRQLVRRLRICVDARETPRDSPIVADLLAHESDHPDATIEGLICAGRMADAEAALLREFAGDWRSVAIDSVQPAAAQPAGTPSIWAAGWADLAERPAVRAALEKHGRALPKSLWSGVPSGS